MRRGEYNMQLGQPHGKEHKGLYYPGSENKPRLTTPPPSVIFPNLQPCYQ